jgi:hypothetical protein
MLLLSECSVAPLSHTDTVMPGSQAPRNRLYYSPHFFPVFRYDVITNTMLPADSGPWLLLLALLMGLAWAIGAAVFISPSYIGIAIVALVKVLTLQYIVHVQHNAQVRVRRASGSRLRPRVVCVPWRCPTSGGAVLRTPPALARRG